MKIACEFTVEIPGDKLEGVKKLRREATARDCAREIRFEIENLGQQYVASLIKMSEQDSAAA